MSVPLWVRRKFFDSYGQRPNEFAAKLPPGGVRFSCPCCGYPTLGDRGCYQICELCFWEDDGNDDPDEVRDGPNLDYSLTDAQLNFEQYLVKYPPQDDPRMGGPDLPGVKALKQRLIAAFDQMLDEPPPAKLDELWLEVQQCERGLERCLKQIIKDIQPGSDGT